MVPKLRSADRIRLENRIQSVEIEGLLERAKSPLSVEDRHGVTGRDLTTFDTLNGAVPSRDQQMLLRLFRELLVAS